MTDLDKLAREIPKSAKAALIRIGQHWIQAGYPGPSRRNAYSLGWGKAGNLKLVEKRCVGTGALGLIWEYRLTPLGLALKAHIERTEQ